jgi:hypothetical protein
MTYEPNTRNWVSGTRDQERAVTKAGFEPSRGGGWQACVCAIEATGTRRSWRAPGWTTRKALLVGYSDHRVFPTRLGSPMIPPYDTVARAILPAPPAAGAEKFSAPLPAGAAPDDVWHRFDLETLPKPVVTFVEAADAVHQYPTRLARGRGRFTA